MAGSKSPLTTHPNATLVVRHALTGSGVEIVGSCGVDAYDAVAPEAFRSGIWMPGARGLVVVGSAGPALWRRLRARLDGDRSTAHLGSGPSAAPLRGWDQEHPLDEFVAEILTGADAALAAAGVRFHRFDAAVTATPRTDFVAMARLAGLGSPGPFGLLIHADHGPWWALRGAWLVDAAVDPPGAHRPPCAGCPAPCVGGWSNAGGLSFATVAARSLCVVGQQSRYDDDQVAYHYDRAATLARLRAGG
jgi:hypothetical protein